MHQRRPILRTTSHKAERRKMRRKKRKVKLFFDFSFDSEKKNVFVSGKKNEGKEKVERTEDSGQGNTPNQGAQLPSSTPTNQEEGGQNRDETKKGTPNGIEEIVNIPTIQIDTPVDYSSNQSLPSELMESIKSRLPSATSVRKNQTSIVFRKQFMLSAFPD